MKGLLLKDWYIAKQTCRSLLFLDVLFVFLCFISGGRTFFSFYLCATSGLLPLTLISYDEREKWDVYAGTLPYTRSQMVSSKYLVGLIQSVTILLLVALVHLILMLQSGAFAWESYVSLLSVLLAISFATPSVLYMIVFKLGSQRGRIVYYCTIGVVCAVSTLLGNSRTVEAASPLLTAVIAAVAVALYAVSWRISIRFYEKREF